jgi:hypothetical protein
MAKLGDPATTELETLLYARLGVLEQEIFDLQMQVKNTAAIKRAIPYVIGVAVVVVVALIIGLMR